MKFAENVATIEGNAVFEGTKKASVDNESLPHIIRSLTDMYSNPLLAVAREYISNAYDATVERMGIANSFGVALDTPIEVTLPSQLHPGFVIQDYGTGMDRSILSDVFLTYGASTKRDTNNQIGGFGLGSKSALAIVQNFTVMSVKNGKKNVGIIQKGEDEVGEISFLPETATDEPSGTVVTISLSAADSRRLEHLFKAGSNSLLLGFPHGSIKINGKMHDNSVFNTERYTKVGDFGYMPIEILTRKGKLFSRPLPPHLRTTAGYSAVPRYVEDGGSRTVLVGPISYTVHPNDLKEANADRINQWFAYNPGILSLPIGSVDITPARENLIFSDRTCNAILNIAEQMQTEIISRVSSVLESCSTRREALKFITKASQYIKISDEDRASLTWNSEVVPKRDWSLLMKDGHSLWITDTRTGTSRMSVYEGQEWRRSHTIPENLKILMVTGLQKGERLNEYEEAKKLAPLTSYVLQDQLGVKLTHPENIEYTTLDGGTVVFTSTDDVSIYGEWFSSVVDAVMPVKDFVTLGKKLRSQANKAEREALAKDNLMVTQLDVGSKREAIVQAKPIRASWVKDRKVVYIQSDTEKPDSIGSRIAKSLSAPKSKAEISRAELGAYMHWHNRMVFVILSPNDSVKDLLEVAPEAVSIDTFLTNQVESLLKSADAVSFCYEKYESEYAWVAAMKPGRMVASGNNPRVSAWIDGEELDPILKEVKNPEVRKFLEQISRAKTTRGPYSRVLFESPLFDKQFSALRQEVESLHAKFSLPMVKHLSHPNAFALDAKVEMKKQLISYVNMLYPA